MIETTLKVLVVDDVEDNRILLDRWLSRAGYEVREADSGQSALTLLAHEHFDIVLLDIEMPGLTGFDVLKRLRETDSSESLPVIMVSASDHQADIAAARRLGANDYITKPIDFRSALALVGSHCAH